MFYFKTAVFSVLVSAVWCKNPREFPSGFIFGAATAAYQIEGAWNVSDKGESIWDRFVHTNPGAVKNKENGDVAADSYHNWQQDIDIASDIGLHFYRFSVSWPRLLPTGFINIKSEDGKNYYNKLIDGLLAKGIEPVVTLYHWDLPQPIQDLGGWTNPLIADYFADYANYVFSLFGDRVKTWITINEAISVCDFAYNSGVIAPGIQEPIYGTYLCNKHILIAHAKAYRIYEKYYRPSQHGKVSFANNLLWIEPLTPADEELAELGLQHSAGRYSHPIYSKKGGWPPSIE
ncbi:myrosinase 1-like [Papilio machaon]|uniref:myrosinase 1-like n=1 Tax=Papilio machaon TaxID=76193 RepID=UPI001E662B0B|nr:myrosinase 1-like [Papilio machaon]